MNYRLDVDQYRPDKLLGISSFFYGRKQVYDKW